MNMVNSLVLSYPLINDGTRCSELYSPIIMYLLHVVLLFSICSLLYQVHTNYIIPANLKAYICWNCLVRSHCQVHTEQFISALLYLLLELSVNSWNYFLFSIHQRKLPNLNQLPRYNAMQQLSTTRAFSLASHAHRDTCYKQATSLWLHTFASICQQSVSSFAKYVSHIL